MHALARGRVGRAAVAAALVGLAATAAPLPTGGVPERAGQAAPLAPEVLVPLAVSSAGGVAVGPDGTTYVTDAARGGLHAVAADGAGEQLARGVLSPTTGVAVAPDGTVAVAYGSGVAVLGADGPKVIPGASDAHTVAAVAYTSDGQLWALDDENRAIQRVDGDGPPTDVYGSADQLRGLAAGPDDALFTIDRDTGDVLRRAADGTVTTIDFATLSDPRALDVEGDRIAVAVNGGVVIREGDGTEAPVPDLAVGNPLDVDLLADGTVLVAFAPNPSASSPSIGGLLRKAPGQAAELVPVGGDVVSTLFASIAPAAGGGAVFASWTGAPAYSDPNPLRSAAPGRAVADVTAGGAGQRFDAAPDGTLYRTDLRTLWRVAPDGTTAEVALPTEPGLDAVIDVAVDEDGRAFVALGSGYGPGGWRVVRLEADGSTTPVAEDRANGAQLESLGAGGGLVLIAAIDGDGATQRLLEVRGDGTTTTRAELAIDRQVQAIEVDAAGDAYVVRPRTGQSGRTAIEVIGADGAVEALDYEARTGPETWRPGSTATSTSSTTAWV
ncbi:MAG: hypothetical protein R2711_06660 [Acidimicrobiales bacterium]